MRSLISILIVIVIISGLNAQVKTREIPYTHGEVELKGTLVYDPLLKSIRSAILVFPDIWGIDDHIKANAEKLALQGHIILIADLQGKQDSVASIEQGLEKADEFLQNMTVVRERATTALDLLRSQNKVDPAKIGVVGYGLGATVGLELAMTGANISAHVWYYPRLTFEEDKVLGDIKGDALILLGANDTYISEEDLADFTTNLKQTQVAWQLIMYGGAVRGFCNSKIGFDVVDGMAYNYNADLRSYESVRQFFNDLLK